MRSEEIKEWLEENAEIVRVTLPVAPRSYAYRPVPLKKGGRLIRVNIVPSDGYKETKEAVKASISSLFKKPADRQIVGIVYDHVFSFPKSTSKKEWNRWIEKWGGSPAPCQVNRGDVHDNLNKSVPDAMMELDMIKDDSELFLCMSGKFRGDDDYIDLKIYMIPHGHSSIF